MKRLLPIRNGLALLLLAGLVLLAPATAKADNLVFSFSGGVAAFNYNNGWGTGWGFTNDPNLVSGVQGSTLTGIETYSGASYSGNLGYVLFSTGPWTTWSQSSEFFSPSGSYVLITCADGDNDGTCDAFPGVSANVPLFSGAFTGITEFEWCGVDPNFPCPNGNWAGKLLGDVSGIYNPQFAGLLGLDEGSGSGGLVASTIDFESFSVYGDVSNGQIAVPEPSSMVLLGLGLAALAGMRRKLGQ